MKIEFPAVAVADPKLVRALLIPRHRRFGSVDLDAQAILSAGGTWLAVMAPRVRSPMRKMTAPKSSVSNWGFYVIFRTQHFVREGFDGALGLFAGLVEGLQIRAQANSRAVR